MTVAELIAELSKLPQDIPAVVKTDNYFGYYSEVNTVSASEVEWNSKDHSKVFAVEIANY